MRTVDKAANKSHIFDDDMFSRPSYPNDFLTEKHLILLSPKAVYIRTLDMQSSIWCPGTEMHD